jgi:hypothetical protein
VIDPFYKEIVDGIQVVSADHRARVTVESERRGEWARVGYDVNEGVLVVEIHTLEDAPVHTTDLTQEDAWL